MVQPEEVEPVEDVFEAAFFTMAPAGEEIVERFGSVFLLISPSASPSSSRASFRACKYGV
jgi:hypothetical protein